MNQDVTAPVDLSSGQVPPDATTQQREHALTASDNLRWGELGTFSHAMDFPGVMHLPPLRNMVFIASAAVRACNAAFVPHTVATFGDVSSVVSALRNVTRGGRLYAETSEILDLSVPPTEATPKTVLERFTRALGEWRGLLAPDHFDGMARHIKRLLSDEEELDEDNVVLSSNSFDDMLAFLASRPWDKFPAVGINRRGQFSASWARLRPYSDVTVTFLGENAIKWYVYGLGTKGKGSATGTSDRVDLPGLLSRLGCDSWMAR